MTKARISSTVASGPGWVRGSAAAAGAGTGAARGDAMEVNARERVNRSWRVLVSILAVVLEWR